MEEIFKNIRDEAKKEILNSSDRELFSEGIEKNIFNLANITIPYLDKDQIEVSTETEIISLHNAPPGINFIPGEEMQYVLYSVPIIGDINLTQQIFARYHWGQDKFIRGNSFCYKAFFDQNTEQATKEKAKAVINDFQARLDKFEEKYKNFIQTDLKPYATHIINEERKRRTDKKDTENRLNPFL